MDRKIRDIDIMVTLLESKLNSLPEEITKNYPSLQHISLDNITPVISIAPISEPKQEVKQETKQEPVIEIINTDKVPESQPVEEIKEEEKVVEIEERPLTPEEKLQAYVEKYEDECIGNYYKSLKMGLIPDAVIQKAMLAGFNVELVRVNNF